MIFPAKKKLTLELSYLQVINSRNLFQKFQVHFVPIIEILYHTIFFLLGLTNR